MNLNGVWEFKPGAASDQPPFGQSLPGRILVPFPIESALSGVMERHDRVWYRRSFTNPVSAFAGIGDAGTDGIGPRVLLHFGAVDFECSVFVNGEKVGEHRGGYDPFTFDVTATVARKSPCELIVRVADPTDLDTQPRGKQVTKPEGIFYTPTTGIWQTVWLEVVPAVALDGIRIQTDVGDRDDRQAKVSIVPFGRTISAGHRLEAVVMQGEREVGRGSLDGPFDGNASIIVAVPQARLWSPEDPFLYDVRLTLRRPGLDNRVIDQIRSYFAIRQVALGKDDGGVTRLFLNGKPYFNLGLLDQGFWPDGIYTAPTDEALRYDIEQTKALGFNTIRKHVKVEPDRWYYWCDKLGVLVWQDMPSGDKYIGGDDPDITRTLESAAQYEAELRAMISQLRNHPCIIMWVPFNEGWGQFDTARITKLIKDLDPTRLVNSASGWTDRGTGDVLDIHAYPGPAAPKWEPARAGVLGEFGGLGLRIDGHTWSSESWGYQGMADQEELTERYVALLRKVHELKEKAGLSAAIYTQTTDVETECNGLMTYDRALVKLDAARVAAANRGEFPRQRVIVPTAQTDSALWRYTTKLPPEAAGEWFKAGFDDVGWARGASGFGTPGTPGAVIGTEWNTPEIWIRRTIKLPREALASRAGLRLLIHHDEDCEVYLNGVLAAKLTGYTTEYMDVRISAEAAAALREGDNLIALHCRQTRGGQYLDAGVALQE